MDSTPARPARARRRATRAVTTLLGVALAAVALLTAGGGPALATSASATVGAPAGAAAAPDPEPVVVTVWWGDGCPRCEELRAHLDDLATTMDLSVVEHEVWHDAAAREDFVAAGHELGFEASAVPATVVGERVWIGWTDAVERDLTATIRAAAQGREPAPGVYGSTASGTCGADDGAPEPDDACTAGEDEGVVVDVPVLGEVGLEGRSLLVSTLVIGFVDGINPCSLWAISVLLTIVVRTASRRRVVAVGATFLGVTAVMYALFMAGIYSALSVVGVLGWVRGLVVAVAGVVGVVSVKDYLAFRRGLSFTIPDSAKPGLYRRMRSAAGHDRLGPALLATAGLGVAVSLLETPCTAGFPVLWTGLLRANGVGALEAVGLFGAYMVPFLLDEVLVVAIAVATMRATRVTERHGELLKLVAGVTMLALAGVMAVDPALMERPLAALAVFAGALAAAAGTHLVTVRVRRARARSTHDGGTSTPEHDDGPTGLGRRGRRTIVVR